MTNIYLITNKLNGKKYVGKTIHSIEHRFEQHCHDTNNTYIDSAIRKYGRANFEVSLLLECEDSEWAYWESHFIEILHTHWLEGGYNLSRGGDNNPMKDEEVQRRHLKACQSESHRNKQRLASTGRRHTSESKAKMSLIQKKVYSDPELRRKVKLHQPTVISVGMLDENENVIKIFDSLSDVCKYFQKDVGNTSSLSKMIDKRNKNGKRSKFWGHAWTRLDVKV